MGSNGVLVSGNGLSSMSSDHATKRKWCGSVDFLKQQMSEISYPDNNHVWKQQQPAFSKLSSDFSDDNQQHQNMLSFSSPKNNGELDDKNLLPNSSFSNFQHPSSFCSKNAGYSCNNGCMNATSMYFMNGVKGAFTATQWCELEQQALIFKYIIANEPIPPNLLIPIRSAFESAPGFSGFPAGLLRPNLFGWGPFHLGLANSTDPEAGRCRRTDGKKWRCSRDAVPDQKYCERHINRGRHRSRKPVEGQAGHSLCGATTNKSSNSNTATVMNMASSSAALDLVGPGGGPSNSFAINLNQSKDLNSLPVHRPMVNKANSSERMQSTFSITESDSGYFPFLSSDGTTLNITNSGSSVSRTCTQSQHSPHFFMDDPSNISWSKLETQANRTTKLSVSIPPADFMSSTSSPTGERIALSPLRLSRELDPTTQVHTGSGMGLGLGLDPRETSLGGPLGEVLKTTTSNSSGDQSKSISALNLLSNGSESSSQLGSSPTGVLGYFSNSSGGSSPRTEYGRALESGGLIGFNLGMRH